jgi:hypothetical protein
MIDRPPGCWSKELNVCAVRQRAAVQQTILIDEDSSESEYQASSDSDIEADVPVPPKKVSIRKPFLS